MSNNAGLLLLLVDGLLFDLVNFQVFALCLGFLRDRGFSRRSLQAFLIWIFNQTFLVTTGIDIAPKFDFIWMLGIGESVGDEINGVT
jgi:hypothetical protein